MRIALLLLARAISQLSPEQFSAFIFVDAKSDIAEFRAVLPEKPGDVTYLADRHAVYYAGWSVVQAELKLLKAALQEGPFERYQLLSGSCYPVLNSYELHRRLSKSNAAELCIWGDYHHLNHLGQKRINRRHFHDLYGALRVQGWPKLLVDVLRVSNRIVRYALPAMRPVPAGIRKGSQWFCVKQATAEQMLRLASSPAGVDLANFLKYSSAADELFFHSMALENVSIEESDFHSNIHLNHFIDWSNLKRPRFLDASALASIRASGCCFCRKVKLPYSTELLQAIDADRSDTNVP
jgi:hypothetical protein